MVFALGLPLFLWGWALRWLVFWCVAGWSWAQGPVALTASGYVTDDSHPRYPGDFRTYPLTVRLQIHADLAAAILEFESGDGAEKEVDRYFFSQGLVYQLDGEGRAKAPGTLGDLAPSTLALIHPALRDLVLAAAPENVLVLNEEQQVFSCNNALWVWHPQENTATRRIFSDVLGDGEETIVYPTPTDAAQKVTVRRRGRDIASFQFEAAKPCPAFELPPNLYPNEPRVITVDDIHFTEQAPHVFTLDLARINTRVWVAEFESFLVVLEGAYSSQNCALLADQIEAKFKKPVRYFAFSHLHGQYIGGVRAWVDRGVTVLAPASTQPLVAQAVAASFRSRPDRLEKSPKGLQFEAVQKMKVIEDKQLRLELHNIDSDHTKDYLIFYFPKSKILGTGDLLFFRPGQPLKGRSKKLCATVQSLGLQVDRFICTWPLSGYGTQNIVNHEEMEKACQ